MVRFGEISQVKLVECPRDAMQGWGTLISTEKKAAYLNLLLKVGFDTLDFGSFVSPETVPQMADTAEVLSLLDTRHSATRLLAIVANEQGAKEAIRHEQITYLGYPFSVSETFQLRNTNRTIAESLLVVQKIRDLCSHTQKELVIYISMGFGNPYGDPYSKEIVEKWVGAFSEMGISIISLSDTVGLADPQTISYLFSHLIPVFPRVEFGAHFHSAPDNWEPKITAAYDSGCRRFDSTIQGIGGCPMAEDKLVGNILTEDLLSFLRKKAVALSIKEDLFKAAQKEVWKVFV